MISNIEPVFTWGLLTKKQKTCRHDDRSIQSWYEASLRPSMRTDSDKRLDPTNCPGQEQKSSDYSIDRDAQEAESNIWVAELIHLDIDPGDTLEKGVIQAIYQTCIKVGESYCRMSRDYLHGTADMSL